MVSVLGLLASVWVYLHCRVPLVRRMGSNVSSWSCRTPFFGGAVFCLGMILGDFSRLGLDWGFPLLPGSWRLYKRARVASSCWAAFLEIARLTGGYGLVLGDSRRFEFDSRLRFTDGTSG